MLRPGRLARRNELFNRACTSSVTLEAYLGPKGDGGRDYAAPATYAALVVEEQHMVRDAEGKEVLASVYVTFAFPPPHVGLLDRITLPAVAGDATPRQPVILAIEEDSVAGSAMFPTVVHT
jgi:hypothetical protein